jgi:large repetitive protein
VFVLTGEAGSRLIVRSIDGSELAAMDATGRPQDVELTLADGEHRIVLLSIDPAGNESPTAEVRLLIDTTAPTAPQATVEERAGGVTIALQGEPDSRWNLDIDGPEQLTREGDFDDTGTAEVILEIPPGEYELSVTATDESGNESDAAVGTFTVAAAAAATDAAGSENDTEDEATVGDALLGLLGLLLCVGGVVAAIVIMNRARQKAKASQSDLPPPPPPPPPPPTMRAWRNKLPWPGRR